jgi:hypothetical protein
MVLRKLKTLPVVTCLCALSAMPAIPAFADQPDLTTRKNLYECQQAAAEYSYNLNKAGDKAVFDKHVQDCLAARASARKVGAIRAGATVPANTPFSYNVGINYESWTMGRNNHDIPADLTAITKYFKMIKTFHAAAVGTGNVTMDPTQQQVIDFVKATGDVELVMGTNNDDLAQGGWGAPWTAGKMCDKSYTDKWVKMVLASFDNDKAKLKKHLKTVLLGNELDQNGPRTTDGTFQSYLTSWIPSAFDNLKASLSEAGLGDLPVSTIIANYPLGDPESNKVASHTTDYVKTHWSPSWNGGKPFLFFNQYTPSSGESTNFDAVTTYFSQVSSKLQGSPDVYVGETGFSAEYGLSGEADVVGQMFNWLSNQYRQGGRTVPLFVFQAFDCRDKPSGQKQMGLLGDDDRNKPTGLKQGITVPAWVASPVSQ